MHRNYPPLKEENGSIGKANGIGLTRLDESKLLNANLLIKPILKFN